MENTYALSDLTTINYPVSPDITLAYDNLNRLTNMVDAVGTTGYSYTAFGALQSEDGPWADDAVTYSYPANRLRSGLSLAQASGPAWSQSYADDTANRLSTLTSPAGAFGYTYGSVGTDVTPAQLIRKLTLPNGSAITNQFDEQARQLGTTLRTSGGDAVGASLRLASYTNNSLNQITGRDVPAYLNVIGAATATATNVNVNNTLAYRKGEYYRVELILNNASAAIWQSVTNRAVQSGTTNSTTGNLFLPKQAEVFSYDADGNLTNDGRWAYVWDGENRLTRMVAPSAIPTGARQTLLFGYDAQGRRISKTVSNWTGSAWSKILDEKYLYDGWNQLTSLNASNTTVVRAFLWGSDLSGSMQGAGGVGGLLAANAKGVGVAFAAFDGNGNVMALVNAADGDALGKYEYGPFGEVIRASGTLAKLNPFRFSTKFQDDETDQLYYGYRYLNASTGRWLNRDPIGERGGKNLYGFVRNSSVRRIDFLGLCKVGDKRNPKCEFKVLAWGDNPESAEAKDAAQQFVSLIENVEDASRAAQILVAGLASGTAAAIESAIEQLGDYLFEEKGYEGALDPEEIAALARKAADDVRGAFAGYNLYTRIKYEECVCKWDFLFTVNGWKDMPRKASDGWKRSAKEFPGYTILKGDDTRFETKLHAIAKADDICEDHLNQFKRENGL